jgi:hypothetical protein
MTSPRSFAPVREQCSFVDFCPRNAEAGSKFCDLHQPKLVAPTAPSSDGLHMMPRGRRGAGFTKSGAVVPNRSDIDAVHYAALSPASFAFGKNLGIVGNVDRGIEALLTFDAPAPSVMELRASPIRPFTPRGLMLWNADHLEVEAAIIGTQHQLVASCGRIPARWFSTAQNFEQVAKALQEGKEPGQGWGAWDSVYPGSLVRLTFTAPVDLFLPRVQALMWGHSLS